MIYKTKMIAGVKFTPAALNKLDRQKWENEARLRIEKIKVEYKKTGKLMAIKLRPQPIEYLTKKEKNK